MRFSNSIAAFSVAICVVTAPSVRCERLDDRPEVVSEYARGKRLLREGNWLGASRVFEQLAGQYPDSKNLDLFVFNRAKAVYYFGNYGEALAGFSSFVRSFPRHANAAHAHFFLGNIHYLRGQLGLAAAGYIKAYGLCNDPRLSELLVSSLAAAIAGARTVSLGPSDLEELPETKRCVLAQSLAEALVDRGEYAAAKELLEPCGRELDVSDVNLDQKASFNAELELAVVLPLSGDLQSFGEDIYNGAIIAAEMYRRETGRDLKLVSYDTRGDPISAARIVKELVGSTTDAVIGPLTSEEAAVAAAALSNGTLPMIAPAATQAGLTLLGDATFQLSPNIEYQGIQMAEYAVFNRRADSAAIVTPTSTDELRMVRAFARRFEQLGGRIVAVEYYRSRDTDFGDYIQDIKAILLGRHPDSMFFVDDNGDTLDADGIPAYLDCLYLPGTPGQLRQLLPQINFYNLETFYLGSDGWGDDAVYRLGDDVTKGAVFPSPHLEQRRSEEYLKFATEYDLRYGKQPQRLAGLGYDAATLTIRAFRDGAVSREELVPWLGKIQGYKGAAATVTFGEHRENIELPLYTIAGGKAVFLGESRTVSADFEEE